MSRRYKFDIGDWVAIDGRQGWSLMGKVVDATSESCVVEDRNGERHEFLPGTDRIAHVRWTGRGKWAVR